MNRRLSLSVAILVAIVLVLAGSPSLFAAKGGGHGGGHAGGRSSGGGSSGHSVGHSVGHSLGHIFGNHSGRRGAHPSESQTRRIFNPAHPLPPARTRIRTRRRIFRRNQFFNSGYCDPFRFSWRNALFPGEFDCFRDSFFFDPFFYGASLNTYFWSDSLTDSGDSANPEGPPEAAENNGPLSAEEPGAAVPLPSSAEKPVALLQLLDGSMYGLTRYWLEGTTLHYVTTYGGENTVPLERVDFPKTLQLNAEVGSHFDLTQNPHHP